MRKIYKVTLDSTFQATNSSTKAISSTLNPIRDMKIYDENDETTNVCGKSNGGCEQFCFFVGETQPKCACVYSKLAANGRNCERYKAFVAFVRGAGIEFAPTFGSVESDLHLSLSAAIERKDVLAAFR